MLHEMITKHDSPTESRGVPIQTYVSEEIAKAIKERAKQAERSIAAEVRLILREAVA